jgi:hypothetical protein
MAGFIKQYFIDQYPIRDCSLGEYVQLQPQQWGNDGDLGILMSDIPETDNDTDVLPLRCIRPLVRY